MNNTVGFLDSDGQEVYTADFVQGLRELDKEKKLKNTIISQMGGQTRILSSKATISFTGGSRGGSKTYSILLEALKDITNPNFHAVILRKEKADLANIIEESKTIYRDYGVYVGSDKDMIWKLNAGGTIVFSYHSGNIDDFKERFQGRQYAYIAVDEVSQIDFDKFLYLLTCLRDSHGIHCRMVASCNPPRKTHWLRTFLDYYISTEDTICPEEFRTDYVDGKLNMWSDGFKHPEMHGYPIPWRDSTMRYCYFSGAKSVADIKWGKTRREVYDSCKSQIDALWSEEYSRFGNPEDLFVMSVTFVEAKLTDNLKLLEGDPAYIARLANQDKSQQMADLKGCWDVDGDSEGYVSESEMEDFFNNKRQLGDGRRRVSIDVALEGGDATVMWLRIGNSFEDVAVFRTDSKNLVQLISVQLADWGVEDKDVTFDSIGVGQLLIGYFKKAIKFDAKERPYGRTPAEREVACNDYDTIKSQAAFKFGDKIKYLEYSINPSLLERRFQVKSGDMIRLRDILMEERKIISLDVRKRDDNRGKCIIKKSEMKRMLGRSPDFMESMFYTEIFEIKSNIVLRPKVNGGARYVNMSRSRSFSRSASSSRPGRVSYR